jgi:hypothetical protein
MAGIGRREGSCAAHVFPVPLPLAVTESLCAPQARFAKLPPQVYT